MRSLIKDIENARRYRASKAGVRVSQRIRRIITDTGGVCLEEADIDGYLSRAEILLKEFLEGFPACRDVFVLRAPGRINLIGEHTDYNGLPVLPMAINRDIVLVASPRTDAGVQIRNTDASLFPPREFDISDTIKPYPAGDWGNYAKAATRSGGRLLADPSRGLLTGFNAVVDGNIPMASGLASSSALVVAFALATAKINGIEIDRQDLAGALACGEHYVGTRGGGMDQTVCLMAQENHALLIDFFPIRAQRVGLPPHCSFVVCHSTVAAPKSSTARTAYNLRAAESRIASAALGVSLSKTTRAPGIVIDRLGDLCSENVGLSDSEVASLVEKTLRKEAYSIGEAAHLMDVDEEYVRNTFLANFNDREMRETGKLKLRSRCRHVLSEGRRVRRAVEALRAGETNEFGRLMYESHESCATDYEVSVPELDTLVEIAKEAGALGSRLTGAGFGGCTISLVRNDNVMKFMGSVEKRYYGQYLSGTKFEEAGKLHRADRMFVCKAVRGAGELFV